MGAAMAYRVTAPYVTVQVVAVAGGPPTTLGFYAGAILPANVDRESAETQVRKGLVERVSADEVPAADVPVEPAPVTKPAAKAENTTPAKAKVTPSEPPSSELVTPADPSRPAKNASKDVWVAYAVTQRAAGVDEDTALADAKALTHTELVAKYGS